MRPDLGKIWVVASTEFGSSIRTKSFIIGLLLLPIIMGLSIGLQLFVAKRVDTRPRTFAVVDRTGALYPAIEQAAKAYNEQAVDAQGQAIRPAARAVAGARRGPGRRRGAGALRPDPPRRARRLRGDPGRGDRAAGGRCRRAAGDRVPLRQPQRRRRPQLAGRDGQRRGPHAAVPRRRPGSGRWPIG